MKKNIILRIKQNKWSYPIILNSVIFICMISLFYVRFASELDIIMNALVSGVIGGKGISHILFNNIIVGGVLSVLYECMPTIPWYIIMHYVIALICMVIITYLICEKNTSTTGRIIAGIVSIFVGYECLVRPMYMKTAAIAAVVSMWILWHQIAKDKAKMTPYIAAIMLALVSSVLSFYVFVMASLLTCLVMFLHKLWNMHFAPDEQQKMEIRIYAKKSWKSVVAMVLIIVLSLGLKIFDEQTYKGKEWKDVATVRDDMERLYAFGAPDFSKVKDELWEAGITDVDATVYQGYTEGLFVYDASMLDFFRITADKHLKFNGRNILQFFRTVPIQAFRTGMFYLWLILAVMLLYKGATSENIMKVADSLLMAGIPYFVMYFSFGAKAEQLGMIAYLPSVVFLLLQLDDLEVADNREVIVYLSLAMLVLYYIFSDTFVNNLKNEDEICDVEEITEELSEQIHLIDFNDYVSKFSAFAVYPKGLNGGNTAFLNGIYAMVPGGNNIGHIDWRSMQNYEGCRFYMRASEEESLWLEHKIAHTLPMYPELRHKSFYFFDMTHIAYTDENTDTGK